MSYLHKYLYLKDCPDIFGVILKFLSVWGVAAMIFKITHEETVFSKMVQFNDPMGYFCE